MQVFLRVTPIPGRDHDIALEPLRAGWFAFWQLAFFDTFRPLGKILDRCACKLPRQDIHHLSAGLAGLRAARPCLGVGREFA